MKFKNPIYVIRDVDFHRSVTYYRLNRGFRFAELTQNITRFWDKDEAETIAKSLVFRSGLDGEILENYFYVDEQDGDKDIKHQYIPR